MSFNVGADAYDRFMGRYSVPLAPLFADFATVADVQRVLDVGCGPGALTAELVRRLGPAAVSAVDPSESFVAAAQQRHPAVAVRRAAAEQLPFADQEFDAAMAQLVVHFMADPVAGLREMGRVTRNGGVVAACVWDHEGGTGPLGAFWEAARQLRPDVDDESGLAGARAGHLAELFHDAGLREIEESTLSVSVEHRDLRGVVGAVHARRRPRGQPRGRPRRCQSGRAPRAVPRSPAPGTVRPDRPRLGGTGNRLALRLRAERCVHRRHVAIWITHHELMMVGEGIPRRLGEHVSPRVGGPLPRRVEARTIGDLEPQRRSVADGRVGRAEEAVLVCVPTMELQQQGTRVRLGGEEHFELIPTVAADETERALIPLARGNDIGYLDHWHDQHRPEVYDRDRMRKILLLWLALACAIGLTAALLPGMDIDGGFGGLLLVALAFSIVNVFIGTILRLLTIPLKFITLGLIAVVVNAVLLAITAWWLDRLSVDNFLTAVVAAVLISAFSAIAQRYVLRPEPE